MDKLILYIFITSVVLITKMINSKEDIKFKINLLMVITNFIMCVLIINYSLV